MFVKAGEIIKLCALVVIRTQRSQLLYHGLDVSTSVEHSGWSFKIYLHLRRQNCTDDAQEEETVLSAVSYKHTHTNKKKKTRQQQQSEKEKRSYGQEVFFEPLLRCN